VLRHLQGGLSHCRSMGVQEVEHFRKSESNYQHNTPREAKGMEHLDSNVAVIILGAVSADYDLDYVDHIIPRFSEPWQIKRFMGLGFMVESQFETNNGVAWRGVIVDGDSRIVVVNHGDGGCNDYSSPAGAHYELARYARDIFPHHSYDECLDTLCETLEIYLENRVAV